MYEVKSYHKTIHLLEIRSILEVIYLVFNFIIRKTLIIVIMSYVQNPEKLIK
jgi:hypothetical protein